MLCLLPQERLDPLVIHHFRTVYPGFEHEAFGVYEQVALSAFHLLPTIVASLLPAYAGRLDRLAIHHASARLGIRLLRTRTRLRKAVWIFSQCAPYANPEVMVDGLLEGGSRGATAPGASTTRDVEDGVEDLAQGVHPGASRGFGGGRWGST